MTKATQLLHEVGQSLWLDNITRTMLEDGTIQRYVDEFSITGLTSNPSIFDKALDSGVYDAAIAAKAKRRMPPEELFFDLAIEDLRRAADMFAPIHETTDGVDGWVSLEVSPTLAYDPEATVTAASELHARAERDNLFIKIPGTGDGLGAIVESVSAGIPVNVTLLFSADQYLAAADAYATAIERRISNGQDANVASVASVFMSRWDRAILGKVRDELNNKLALAIGQDVYRAYRAFLDSERWQRLANAGARPQRLLFASTSTKDPSAPDTLYVTGFAAPGTINTMPDTTLEAFYDHGAIDGVLSAGGGDSQQTLAAFEAAGIDVHQLAAQLQTEGAESFVSAWNDLIEHVKAQTARMG